MVAKNVRSKKYVGSKKYIGSKTNSRRFVEKLNVKFLKILDTLYIINIECYLCTLMTCFPLYGQ